MSILTKSEYFRATQETFSLDAIRIQRILSNDDDYGGDLYQINTRHTEFKDVFFEESVLQEILYAMDAAFEQGLDECNIDEVAE